MYPIETPNQQFIDGNGTTELGTILPAWWLNQVQAELLALLAAGGQTPVKTKHTQVCDAINKMLTDKTPLASASVAGLIKVVNVLTSDGDTAALSAAQGKVLKGLIDGLGDPFKQRGTLGTRNLNDLMGAEHFGVWHQTADASANLALNYPTTQAGTLLVLPSASQGIQLYIPFRWQQIYIRYTSGSPTVAYQPWSIIGEVVNSLTSTSATAALSAAQGKVLNDDKANKTEIKLSRAVVAGTSTAVTLDLTSRASILAALGSDYINNGINQLNLHNNATSNITGLPINDKLPVQLDFVLMGSYSEIIANYMTLNRTFKAAINWNSDTFALGWTEDLTDRNGLKNSGNQTLAGILDIKTNSWGRVGMPTNDGGRWVIEVNPAGENDARVNFGFAKPNNGGSMYIQFPKITANEKVAYESYVAAQMATTVKTTGNQDIAGVKTFVNRQAFYAGLQASDAEVDFDAGRRITLGANTADAWIKNETSGKFLTLKNNGELHYDGSRVPTWGDRSDATNLDDTNKWATSRAVKCTYDFAGTKSTVSVITGTITHGGTIPLPAGFTDSQCRFFISMAEDDPSNTPWDINESGGRIHYKTRCYLEGRVVTAQVFHGQGGSVTNLSDWLPSKANYIVIAYK